MIFVGCHLSGEGGLAYSLSFYFPILNFSHIRVTYAPRDAASRRVVYHLVKRRVEYLVHANGVA